jgi:hypothetical protein
MTLQAHFDVEIDAPDGAAALDLEARLWRLTPTAVGRGSRWLVEVPTVRCPDEVEAVVRQWLDETGERATTMRIGGKQLRVIARRTQRRARYRGPNANFIG